jgi:hypothetical protein
MGKINCRRTAVDIREIADKLEFHRR